QAVIIPKTKIPAPIQKIGGASLSLREVTKAERMVDQNIILL
ncbi:MAG: hypothetical protein UV41_C0007G0020, partial [Candidatus Daviesbacteria bacterium GW2011_GWA2_42_7]